MARGAGLAHRQVLWMEPTRKSGVGAGVTFAAMGVAAYAGVQSVEEPSEGTVGVGPSIVGVVSWAGAALVVIGIVVLWVNLRRWRAANAIAALLNSTEDEDVQPDGRVQLAVSRAHPRPQLDVTVLGRKLRLRRKPRRVTANSNVVGLPPLRIGYLRLFDNQPRGRTFLAGAWRELGPVYFLRSASSVTPAELKVIRRNPEAGFIRTIEELREEFAGAGVEVSRRGWRRFTDLSPTTVFTYDRYGAYEPVPVLCHGSFWKDAVDQVLLTVDLLCLDLSGFLEHNEGTAYELQRVVDRFPVERVVFLCDTGSNLGFLERALRAAWEQMAAGSPNAGTGELTAVMAKTDVFVTTVTTRNQTTGQAESQQTRLQPDRKQTRALGAWLQERVTAVPPPPRAPWTNPTDWTPAPPPVGRTRGRPRWLTVLGAVLAMVLVAGAYFGPRAIASAQLDGPPAPPPPPTTSATPGIVIVPPLKGLSLAEAEDKLKAAGLGWDIYYQDGPEAEDTLLKWDPSGGEPAPSGSVALTVASGFTTVPDVFGFDREDAAEALADAGLGVETVTSVDEFAAVDSVLDQDPDPDTRVEVDTPVTLTIAIEPETSAPADTESPSPTPSETPSPTPEETLTGTPTG